MFKKGKIVIVKMDHVAILDKKRKLLQKILSGEKTIESRWYHAKVAPWDRIAVRETIYFKDSGEPVTVKATVARVEQFYLPQTNVHELIQKQGRHIGFQEKKFPEIVAWCQKRKYGILIHLKDVQRIEPFAIDKTGYGLMAAWITVDDIALIKISAVSV